MKRREFLKNTVRGLVVLVGGIFGWNYYTRQSLAGAVVRRRLGYLPIDPVSLEEFSIQYSRQASSNLKKLLDSYAVCPTLFRAPEFFGARTQYTALEEAICKSYLMSSNFFKNGADENRVIRYLALYDPEHVACSNPFFALS